MEVHGNEFLVRVRCKRWESSKEGNYLNPGEEGRLQKSFQRQDSAFVFRVNGQMVLTFRNKKHRKEKTV